MASLSADSAPAADVDSLLDPSAPPLTLAMPVRDHPDSRSHLTHLSPGLSADHASLPTPDIDRTAPNLRLPSFDLLGIAAPHSDYFSIRTSSSLSLGAGSLSKPGEPLRLLSLPLSLDPCVDAARPVSSVDAGLIADHVQHLVSIVTPPSDRESCSWQAVVNVRTAGLGSPAHSDPDLPPASPSSPHQTPTTGSTCAELGDALEAPAWIDEVKTKIIHESSCLDLDSIRILSHALPCPSLLGHCFSQIITAIHHQMGTHTSWINVFHALPGRYTLYDLPTSPLSAVDAASQGDSYFTSKIFESAVAIPDYQLDSNRLPPSPQPVVPPSSINISVVERYIPPTSTNEYSEMFSLRRRSLLHDRLVELSADRGVMLFVYPTRTGARTFVQRYLGPILDPLLRTVTVVHDLHSDLGTSLGRMVAVNHLDEFDQLEVQMKHFCHSLSARSETESEPARYEVIHAAKEQVKLDRAVWADDWWIQQEKCRIREEITSHLRRSRKTPVDDMTGPHIVQEVLDGVSKREYQTKGPAAGVEVGLFIIKKSHVQ